MFPFRLVGGQVLVLASAAVSALYHIVLRTMPDGIDGDFGPYCIHGPNVYQYLQEMNQEVLSKYDIMTVGETAV